MVGALSYQASREPRMRGVPALGRYARRYAGGGEVGGSAAAVTPSATAADAALGLGGISGATAPQGILATAAEQGPNPDAAKKANDLRTARLIMAASNGRQPVYALDPNNLPVPPLPLNQSPPDQPPAGPVQATAPDQAPTGSNDGRVNMPLLMAAAGMLKGGHPGGFGADLGYALEEGGNSLEKQRQLEENARLRMAQQADTAAYRAGMLAVNQQKANTGDDRAASYGMLAQAHATIALAKATAGAGAHATLGDLQQAGIKDLLTQTDPETGKPYTLANATMLMTGALARNLIADAATTRADTGQKRADDNAAYQTSMLALKKAGYNDAHADRVARAAASGDRAAIALIAATRDPIRGPTMDLPKARTQLGTGVPPTPAAPANAPPPDKRPPVSSFFQ